KRLGNAVDPFSTIEEHGSDPLRWYMITNASPWENIKFDPAGIGEVKRKFFGTLYNTYSFFALYANIDGFSNKDAEIPFNERPEMDRWVLSLLNSLTKEVQKHYENYDPTRAGRAIQNFVIDNLSNWYVRLSRKRYWVGEYTNDKISAYQTLYTCLETIALISAPIAPFYMDRLYRDLKKGISGEDVASVHLATFPDFNEQYIDSELETRMDLAQRISSMILGLRRKVNIKVRQPLNLIKIPIRTKQEEDRFRAIETIVTTEVNVKSIELIDADTDTTIVKKIKPNFKALGPKFGKMMKQIAAAINGMDQEAIGEFESEGEYKLNVDNQKLVLSLDDVEIAAEDIPGWLVASDGKVTVAMDVTITEELREEGIARELINRIQNFRKESGLDVTDKIVLSVQKHEAINSAIENFKQYIGSQTLAKEINLLDKLEQNEARYVEVGDDVETYIKIEKAI
ncbi:MAG: isoleucine--tRNA ligase, partial [Marinilabiliales bacterium]